LERLREIFRCAVTPSADVSSDAGSATLVGHIGKEVERLRTAGVSFRNDILHGPGGAQVLVMDPSGNLVELFEPAGS